MCLIIAKPAHAKLPDVDSFEAAYENNSDGFGISAVIGNRIVTERTLGACDEIIALIRSFDARATGPMVLHWRYCTNGPVNLANTHPFILATKERHGLDAIVAHNGVIDIDHEKTESDTAAFCRTTLAPMVRHGVGMLHSKPVLTLAEMAIGSGSKLAILTSDGRLSIVNPSAGFWDERDGCWYSNHYSLVRYARYQSRQGVLTKLGWESWEDDSREGTFCLSKPAQTVTQAPQQTQGSLALESFADKADVLPQVTRAPVDYDDDSDVEPRALTSDLTLDSLRGLSYSDCVSLAYQDPDTAAELLYEAAGS